MHYFFIISFVNANFLTPQIAIKCNDKNYKSLFISKIKNIFFNANDTVTYVKPKEILLRQVNNNLQYYITDARSSVVKVINENNKEIKNYNYNPYGLPIVTNAKISSNHLIPNRMQYNGK